MKYLNYKFSVALFFVFLISCSKTVQQKDLQKLNGYWEIDLVESAHKKIKKYGMNTTVDFFKIDDKGKGYRKKMKPDFSGKYKTNHIKDTLQVVFKNEHFILQTRTAYDSWEEIIVKLTDDELVLENDKGILFHYRKHKKYNFNE